MFKRNPNWLPGVLDDFQKKSLDELMLRGDGYAVGTKKQKNIILKENFLRGAQFTRDLQEFSLSRGLRLDPRSPFAGGVLDCASYRWQIVIPPVAKEAVFVLRKHRFDELSLEDFSYKGELRSELQTLLARRGPFLVAGATGSGKSSFLQVLMREFFQEKRLLILEEYEELPLSSPLWIRLLGRKEGIEKEESFSLELLFKEALRLRPDQLVMGELRAKELKVFLEACHSGHSSSCGTIHGGSVEELKRRVLLVLGDSYEGLAEMLKGFSLGVIFLNFEKGDTPQVEKIEELTFS